MKTGFLLLLGCVPVLAQGWGQRQMMQLWMQGDFAAAELNFFKVKQGTNPAQAEWFLSWQADYEIERARYGVAARLLEEAKSFRNFNSREQQLLEKRLARLYCAVGQFSQAEKIALEGQKWKNEDVKKLRLREVNFVTLGEIYIAKGKFSLAIQILEKASASAKKDWKTDSPSWIRAQNDIVTAELSLGHLQAAVQAAVETLSVAGREWGPGSIPYLDSLDSVGLVRIYESKTSEAETFLSQSRTQRESLYGSQHPKVAASYIHGALLRAAQMDNKGAAQLLTKGLEIETFLALNRPNGRWALALLSGAEVLTRIGQTEDAKDLYNRAIPVLERELGADAPRVQSARQQCADLTRK